MSSRNPHVYNKVRNCGEKNIDTEENPTSYQKYFRNWNVYYSIQHSLFVLFLKK